VEEGELIERRGKGRGGGGQKGADESTRGATHTCTHTIHIRSPSCQPCCLSVRNGVVAGRPGRPARPGQARAALLSQAQATPRRCAGREGKSRGKEEEGRGSDRLKNDASFLPPRLLLFRQGSTAGPDPLRARPQQSAAQRGGGSSAEGRARGARGGEGEGRRRSEVRYVYCLTSGVLEWLLEWL